MFDIYNQEQLLLKQIKMLISKLVRMARFWNNVYQVRSKSKVWKPFFYFYIIQSFYLNYNNTFPFYLYVRFRLRNNPTAYK